MGTLALDDAAETPSEGSTKPLSQTQRATRALRDMIVENRLPPGSSYLETELADMLGMSRTPIREAAVMLEAHGLVEVRPRRGIRVLPLSIQDMEEIYSVLAELEGLAAELAAQRPVNAAQRKTIEQLLDRMDAALAGDDRITWAETDSKLHRYLISMANNRRLESIASSFYDQVQRARIITLRLRPSLTKSNQEHREICGAIFANKSQRARDLSAAHRTAAKKLIISLLREHGFHQV